MKTLFRFTLAAALLVAGPAFARDAVQHFPLQDVLDMPEAKGQLDGSVKFFLAGQKTPKVLKRMSTDVSNKKTNSVGKSDEFGCRWAALSALVAFQNAAKRLGANAVVDITSYYKKIEYKDAKQFECHAGNIVVGVTLRGTYATIP